MLANAKLSTKLTAGFLAVAFITGMLGVVAYVSIGSLTEQIYEIGGNRMPSVQSLLVVSEAQTAIDSAENALLYAKLDATGVSDSFKRFTDAKKRITDGLKIYDPLPQTPEEERIWKNEFLPAWNKWMQDHDDYEKLAKEYHQGQKTDANYEKMAYAGLVINGKSFGPAEAALNKVIDLNSKLSEDAVKYAEGLAKSRRLLLTLVSVFSVVFATVLGFFMSRSISRSIMEVSHRLDASSTEVAAATEQLSAASQKLSESASESASSLEETSSSMEEFSSMVQRNAANAREVNTLAQSSRSSAEKGDEEIRTLIAAMDGIVKGSKKIEEIISVIDDIAFQTNLLALNAAVEAARAGEHGKGFAVVAEAVRNLAQRSATAAKEISSIIKESVSQSGDGARIAEKSGESLKEILVSSKKVADLISEIASASQEQTQGIGQISQAISQIDQATQGNAATSEEAAATSEELSAQASNLRMAVTDLVRLVQGSNGQTEDTDSYHGQRYASQRQAQARPLAAARQVQGKGVRQVSKKTNVIPFDGEDPKRISKVSGF